MKFHVFTLMNNHDAILLSIQNGQKIRTPIRGYLLELTTNILVFQIRWYKLLGGESSIARYNYRPC